MPRSIDPELLAELDAESRSIASTSTRFVRLTLEKNDEATLRILPASLMGNLWYAKIAKHWIGKKGGAIVCPKLTHPRLGGDPNATCPVCDFVEKNRNHKRATVANKAFSASGKVSYTVYCLVRSSTSRAFRAEHKDTAHEFTLYPTAMDELLSLYRRQAKRDSYIEDAYQGTDIFCRRGKSGTKIELDEPCPLYPESDKAKLEKRIKAIMATINFKAPEMPSHRDLDKFSAKLEDYCFADDDDDDDDRGSRRGSRDDDDDDRGSRRGRDDDDRGSRRGSRDDDDRGSRRGSRDDDDDDRDTRGSRGSRDDDADDARPRGGSRDDDDRGSRRGSRDDDRGSRDDDRGSRTSSRADDDEIPGLGTPPPSRRSSPPPSVNDEAGDDDADAAEERRDHVDPATPPDSVAAGADDEPEQARVPARPSRLQSRLQKRI